MTSSWAQSNIINTTSNTVAGYVIGPLPISFTGKLSNKGSVDAATLAATAPGGGTLEFAAGYQVPALSTGQVGMVIGTSLGTSNVTSGVNSGAVVLVGYNILTAFDFVDPKSAKTKSGSLKFTSGWREDGFGRINGTTTDFLYTVETVVSNACLLVSGTVSGSAKSTNVSAKVSGVWFDGATTIAGSIKTGKPTR